tara:strand:+ start:530 stop:697 length:168 start_codon:yes stop_codon:yes gene_type:complete
MLSGTWTKIFFQNHIVKKQGHCSGEDKRKTMKIERFLLYHFSPNLILGTIFHEGG